MGVLDDLVTERAASKPFGRLTSSRNRILFVLAVGGCTLAAAWLWSPLVPGVSPYVFMAPAIFAVAIGAGTVATLALTTAGLAAIPLISQDAAWVEAGVFAAGALVVSGLAFALDAAHRQVARCRERLAEREEVLGRILRSAPLLIVGGEGAVLDMSGPARAMFRLEDASPVGRPITAFIDGFNPIEFSRSRSADRQVAWTGLRADGETFPLSVEIGAAQTNDDPLILSLADLGEWQAADARAANIQAQLSVIGRMDSMGRMAAIIAHELNQPLAAAGIYLHAARKDLAQCGAAGESGQRTMDLAKDQILRAGDIIRKMRELLSQGTHTLQEDRVSSIVVDLLPITDLRARDGDAAIRYDIDMTKDRVLAERIQIQQAVINLINNAVDAVRGQTRRDVHVIGRAVSEAEFEISVEDSGPGIEAEDMEELFRPLNSSKKDGMGLGLSIVRTIVESHGGTLSVRPSSLGGAAFCFTLMRA